MPPRLTVRHLLLSCLYLPAATALQQQSYSDVQQHPNSQHPDALSVASAAHYDAADSLDTPLNRRRGSASHSHPQSSSQHNERALATFSPPENRLAAREPPAPRSSATTAGLSRQPARSLQDWQVEDIILLATVDGKIYARDRTTGSPRWLLEVDRPMVETVYHPHNKSVDQDGIEHEDPIWIVEPSQDGSIYMYLPGTGLGLQRLGYTVKQLAELSPYASEGPPPVAYTAEKKNTLYTIDAATGHILKKFSAAGAIRNDNDNRCRRVSPLDNLEEDECEAIGTITLGHTEYTIGIQDRDTGEQISTIKYFEWGPNNRDQDLRGKYDKTMDGKYVTTKHDGYIYGLDLNRRTKDMTKPLYLQKLSAPVARVYDIMRPATQDRSSDATLVVLPQPSAPLTSGFPEDQNYENIFVNCTENGSWYALSESTYPAVTEGAKLARCYNDGSFKVPSLPLPKKSRDMFTGIHWLAPHQWTDSAPMLPAPPDAPLGIEAPPQEDTSQKQIVAAPSNPAWDAFSFRNLVLVMLVGLAGCGVIFRDQMQRIAKDKPALNLQPIIDTVAAKTMAFTEDKDMPTTPMLREAEPAEETIFPNNKTAEKESLEPVVEDEDDQLDKVESNESPSPTKDTPKGKPHKRGKRGGRKAREKEQAAAEKAKARNGVTIVEVPEPAEVITVAASESAQISGPLQINSLIIHTDRVIGQGSCGTSVFEGSFEGRDVAVKRMLSQYYELASQEVSFLQQSDDHPNVVRYFCQQKDDHFLYIAVELCQASLFEVWEAEKARSDERQHQLSTLKHSIMQDVPKALQQLAAGLYHLHNLRIIHRDIKPQNILVAYPKRGQSKDPRLVISDFGLGKNLPENVSTLIDPTGNAGTSGWKAPELISQPRDSDSRHSQNNSHTGGSEGPNGTTVSGVKRAADIFSLGCLFFWVLTDGNHPFEDENGWHQLRELNIKRDHKNMAVLEQWSDAYEPMQLIESMLQHQPERRPNALQVLNHPFFWSPDKRLAFLCDVSDHFEREPRGTFDDGYVGDSYDLRVLESRAEEVIGDKYWNANFLAKLDRHFVDTLGKQRKYCGNRLLDLLRALRNKKNHYEDMPEDVKKRVGALPGGYLNYWCHRFPRLLMACYEVVHDIGIQDTARFQGYFALGSP